MKRIISYRNARIPLFFKDLQYLGESTEEVFDAVLRPLRGRTEDYILCGCEITVAGNKVAMESGWAYYRGSILPVRRLAPTTYTGDIPIIKLIMITDYDHSGDRNVVITGNSQIRLHNAYQEAFLKPELSDPLSVIENYRLAVKPGFWNLKKRIANLSEAYDTGLVATPYPDLSYRQIGGVVQLTGNMFNDALGGFHGEIASGLPHPATSMRFPISASSHASANDYFMLTITGNLLAYTESSRIYFDNIMYLATPVTATDDGHLTTLGNSGNQQ